MKQHPVILQKRSPIIDIYLLFIETVQQLKIVSLLYKSLRFYVDIAMGVFN